MNHKELSIRYTEYSQEECPEEILNLYKQALEAAGKAYAPFSGFQVGAALQLADGSIYQSNNQENPAYPSGLCAERTGLFYVNSIKPDTPVIRMVLVALDQGKITENPVYPCGACRQVMVESEDRGTQNIETWMFGSNKIIKVDQAADLLPLKFSFTKPFDQ